MKILVIDDDEIKRRRITSFIHEAYPSIELIERSSYNSGLRAIVEGKFDLVLLDMTMPTFDISPEEGGGRPQPYAGKKILLEMVRRDICMPVVIVTQFDRFGEGEKFKTLPELDRELKAECSGIYLGSIYYHATQDEWQGKIKMFINKTSVVR